MRLKQYRVTIDTFSECYVYEVDAEDKDKAESQARTIAADDGWNGGGLPKITVERIGC